MHSNSTTTNQLCLEIICYRIRFSFDSVICPYYPACINYCYHLRLIFGLDVMAQQRDMSMERSVMRMSTALRWQFLLY